MSKPRPSRWCLSRGATVLPDGGVRFTVWSPRSREVTVAFADHGGRDRSLPLEPAADGLFMGVVDDAREGCDYWYRLDGGPPRPDPVSRSRPAGVHGPTRVVDPASFDWSDAEWRGLPTADLIIYELHIGTFTPGGIFDSAIERLPALKELGVTAIEIMPVAEFPGGRNWGYDGVSLYAPQSSYGGPDGLRRLVNACHAQGLAVILDVVYNHLGPEGNYINDFGPYFSDRHHTAWGDGWNLDGPDSDEVRRYLVENALYWITEFHVDGLRLDAADKIVDQSAQHILEELVTTVRRQLEPAERHINLIAESDANDPRFIQPVELGGYGLDAQWTDDFHHAVHVALTGERQGYFQDFGGVGPVAKALAERFVNDGRYSPYRRRRYGRPAAHLPSDRFVVSIQNHDQIGNRAAGERLSTLVPPEALRLGATILLLSPYVPLLFMGEEYGETNPFLYFVSHGDPALVQAVREGRRREFAAFGWMGEVPDPQSEQTFLRSRLDWSRTSQPAQAQLRALYHDLLQLRRTEAALRPGMARVAVTHNQAERWVRATFSSGNSEVTAAFNFADAPRSVPLVSEQRVILSTDAPQYGGSNCLRVEAKQITLPAWSSAALGKSDA